MSKLHYMTPAGPLSDPMTVRLGASATSGANLSVADEGKAVKFVADSNYDLCAAGDAIHGFILAVEVATSGGWTIGGVIDDDEQLVTVTADGLQATAGTGTIAVGDYVVAGTITAKGTKLTAFPKVCKATIQLGDVPASLTAAAAQTVSALYAWKVVSLGTVGTGAVGTTIVIKRI